MGLGWKLVTTAEERTWPKTDAIIFLENSCLKYNRKHIWSKLNFIVAAPPTLDIKRKINNKNEAKKTEKLYFPILVKILNEYHKVNFSSNYWQILIGPWFEIFINIIIERKTRIEDAINSHSIDGANFIEIKGVDLIPKDLSEAMHLFRNNSYISSLDLIITSNMDNINFPILKFPSSAQDSINYKKPRNIPLVKILFKDVKKLISEMGIRLVRNHDPFISSTYLPLREQIKLELRFKQFPKIWANYLTFEVKTSPNTELRHSLYDIFEKHSDSDIISKLIFKLIPVCYLEGYNELFNYVRKSKLPKNPKFIFTSNDFSVNEVFKLYAAQCTEKNVKYFIGQHGNNYGTNKFLSPSLEEKTATKFLTWGWGENSNKYLPAFVFKVAGITPKINKKGGLLLVQFPIGHEILDFNSLYDIDLYFQDQIRFIQGLALDVRNSLTIKLHPGSPDGVFNVENQFKNFDKNLEIESKNINIRNIIAKSRLIVFSYDSTGILENLALNIPTLAFWQFELNHLNESSKFYYQILVDAGIIHFSADSVSEKINQVWTDIELWWASASIQSAREEFCFHYARTSDRPIRDLHRLLTKNARV